MGGGSYSTDTVCSCSRACCGRRLNKISVMYYYIYSWCFIIGFHIYSVCTPHICIYTCCLDSTLSTPFLSPFSFVFKYPHREASWFFNTLHHSQKTTHLTLTVGHHRFRIAAPLTQLSSLLFPLSSPFLFCYARLTAFPWSRRFVSLGRPSTFYCALDLQVSLAFLSLISSLVMSKLRTCFGY